MEIFPFFRLSPKQSEGGADDNYDVNMEENPAYDDLKMKGKGTSLFICYLKGCKLHTGFMAYTAF